MMKTAWLVLAMCLVVAVVIGSIGGGGLGGCSLSINQGEGEGEETNEVVGEEEPAVEVEGGESLFNANWVPGEELASIELASKFTDVVATHGQPDSTDTTQTQNLGTFPIANYENATVFVFYNDANHNGLPDGTDTVRLIEGGENYAGTFQGIGIGSVAQDVIDVFGPAGTDNVIVSSDGQTFLALYPSRGCLFQMNNNDVGEILSLAVMAVEDPFFDEFRTPTTTAKRSPGKRTLLR